MNLRTSRVAELLSLSLLVSLVRCSSEPSIDSSTGTVRQHLDVQLPANVVADTLDDGTPILDPNGIPLNPLWGVQYNQLHNLIGAADAESQLPPMIMEMCDFHVSAPSVTHNACTDQDVYANTYSGDLPGMCPDALGIGLNGHLNWAMTSPADQTKPHAVTIQGPMHFWGKELDDPFHDGDYNIAITADPVGEAPFLLGTAGDDQTIISNRLLLTHPNGTSPLFQPSHTDHMLIEFQDAETVYRYPTYFWYSFKSLVETWTDARANGVNLPYFNGYGITTGLFGVDGVHDDPLGVEIHPAWAFSARIDPGGIWLPAGPLTSQPECIGVGQGRFQGAACGVDRWMTFVRNIGNEGNCSTPREQLTFADNRPVFKVAYPWFGPKHVNAKVTPVVEAIEGPDDPVGLVPLPLNLAGGFQGIDPVQTVQDDRIVGKFDFDASGLNVAADVTLVYGSARLFGQKGLIASDGTFFSLLVPLETFVRGDFNGDGWPDIAHVFPEGGNTSIDVYTNNGSLTGVVPNPYPTLAPSKHWAIQQWPWLPRGKVLAGDFDGDGRDDIAFAFPDDSSGSDRISIDVHHSSPTASPSGDGTDGFEGQARWTPIGGAGAWVGSPEFVAGDFTGDRRADIAYIFLDDRADPDAVSIDVYESSATGGLSGGPSFLGQVRWSDMQGAWIDNHQFSAADFNGDGRLDIGYGWRSENTRAFDVYRFSPTARNGTSPGFLGQARWLDLINQRDEGGFFMPGDFVSDGAADAALIFPNDFTGSDRISIDVNEANPTLNGGIGAFENQGRWVEQRGPWLPPQYWATGDFDQDCAADIVHQYGVGGLVTQDMYRNLFVPSKKTVGFDYVPPNITTTTCGSVATGQARAARCNPALSVSNNAPATFPIGQTPVVWTVTDTQAGGQPTQVTQIITVEPGADPSCFPPGTTVVQDVTPFNPSFDRDVNPMNGIPDGWTPGGANPTLVPGYAGGQAVKLTATAQTPNVYVDTAVASIIDPPATAGLFLHVRAIAYTGGALTLGSWEVNFKSSTGVLLGSSTNWTPPSSYGVLGFPGQWKTFEGEYPIPVGARTFGVRLRARSNSAGYIIFDDLVIKTVRHQ